MKVIEDSPSKYLVSKNSLGVFLFSAVFISVGVFVAFQGKNTVGIIMSLIGIGVIFLPFMEKIEINNQDKTLSIYWGGILGKRKRTYNLKDIKKFSISQGRKDIQFNANIFSQEEGFIERITLFSLHPPRTTFFLSGFNKRNERIDIKEMPILNRIAELCGKKEVEYLNGPTLIKEIMEEGFNQTKNKY